MRRTASIRKTAAWQGPAVFRQRRIATAAAVKRLRWDGIDLNEGNIMVSLDGQPKFVDIFCVEGASYYEALLYDPAAWEAAVPHS